jgi:hypothetical protein
MWTTWHDTTPTKKNWKAKTNRRNPAVINKNNVEP